MNKLEQNSNESLVAPDCWWPNRVLARAFIGLITLYQWTLGAVMPPTCRFQPSCSRYTQEAIRRYGPFRGTWLGIGRILRCNPFCKGGHDAVP